MAFIRSLSQRGLDELGDPGRKRGGFFRKLRKLKVGRFLGKVARVGAGLIPIPGVGGLVSRLAAKYGVPGQSIINAARAAGYDIGDDDDDDSEYTDFGDPGARVKKTPKRKQAASGTKAKSRAKKARRKERRASGRRKGKRPSGASQPSEGGGIPSPADFIQDILREVPGVGAVAGAIPRLGKKGPALFGGRRRSMNPTNVKALRRSIRRVEGFTKLVKRVERQFPKMIHARSGSRSGSPRHRTGCRCVVCRRAA